MNKSVTVAAVLYAATIPAANWMISNVGTQAFPGGPHTIPVGFGYSAPSGVLMIGLALVTRDIIQRLAGRTAAVAAITVGVTLSFVLADPSIAVASAVAFGLGELADLLIYTPLQRRHLVAAVAASGIVGGAVDSFVFLRIAFGSIEYWQGQVIGKTLVSLLGAAGIWATRRASSRRIATA